MRTYHYRVYLVDAEGTVTAKNKREAIAKAEEESGFDQLPDRTQGFVEVETEA